MNILPVVEKEFKDLDAKLQALHELDSEYEKKRNKLMAQIIATKGRIAMAFAMGGEK